MGVSTTGGEPPSYHGKLHTHGTLQHPGYYANRRLIRHLGTTQEYPNGQWSLLMVRCTHTVCTKYRRQLRKFSVVKGEYQLLRAVFTAVRILMSDIEYSNKGKTSFLIETHVARGMYSLYPVLPSEVKLEAHHLSVLCMLSNTEKYSVNSA